MIQRWINAFFIVLGMGLLFLAQLFKQTPLLYRFTIAAGVVCIALGASLFVL